MKNRFFTIALILLFALPLPFPARHRPAAPFLFFGLWCSPLCA